MTVDHGSPNWTAPFFGLIAIVAVLSIPFFAVGWTLEPEIQRWLIQGRLYPAWVGAVGFLALVSDIFLPVPSSFVCTTVGQVVGVLLGTAICTLGLQTGAWLGWLVGRHGGLAWTARWGDANTLRMGQAWLDDWGVWAILMTRPIPLLAEAVSILLGTHRSSFWRWFGPMLISNASLSFAWCALGQWSAQDDKLWLASTLSVVVPTVLLVAMKLFYSSVRTSHPKEHSST